MLRWLVVVLAITACTGAVAAEKPGDRGAPPNSTTDPVLDGVWQGFVVNGRGEQPDRGNVHLELTIKGHQIVSRRLDAQGGTLGQGTYTISPNKTLWLLDATEARKGGKGRTYLGICTFAPDTMRWCVSTPGNARPTTAETKGQQFLLVLKRQRQ